MKSAPTKKTTDAVEDFIKRRDRQKVKTAAGIIQMAEFLHEAKHG